MKEVMELLRQGKKEEIWRRYCGFMDLDIHGYMALQRSLLEEQLPRLAACELGRCIMKDRAPRTLEEFRSTVPFTTYKDYAPQLLGRREETLPEKPLVWAHTSGRSGEFELKWVPYTRRMWEVMGEVSVAGIILSAARSRGEVILPRRMKIPYLVAPPPYVTGLVMECVKEFLDVTVLPSQEEAVAMDFPQRTRAAFGAALNEGLDFFFGLPSVLLKAGERFSKREKGGSAGRPALKPKAFFRMTKAMLKARLQGRPLLPKDIWKLSGAVCGGSDTAIFRNRVAETWGIEPLEGYMSTEYFVGGIQSWARGEFVFYPKLIFWEFIAEKDYHELMANPSYIPPSATMEEVKPGTEYVVAGTSFHGGVLARYIIGDLVKVVSLEDRAAGIHLPHIAFVARIDGLIDVGGFTRLTEKIVWQAIEESGVAYEEWTIRKEFLEEKPILHLYIELRDGVETDKSAADKVHAALKKIDEPYRDLEEMAGMKPIIATVLSKGTFQRYYEERQAAGADLGHLKPSHVGASDKVIENLLRMSSWKI